MRGPRHLTEAWPQIRRQMRQARCLALLTDFDGTLASIRSAPGEARLSPSVHNLLAAISESGVTVGVISGRSLADLRAQVGLRGVWYVGTHGLSLCPPKGRPLFLATAAQKKAVARVRRKLIRQLDGLEGIYLERKPASVAVHYRHASGRNRVLALDAVRSVLQEVPGVRLLAGKSVWELLPASSASKWSAIQRILRHEPRSRRLVFYLGDDFSDEEVFEKLKDITVAVGKSSRTSARFFLRSPGEVRQFLRDFRDAIA